MTWVSFWQRQLKSKLNYNSQQFRDNAIMKFENLQNFKIPFRLLRTPMPRPASRWTNFTNYVGSKICQISKLDNKLSDFVEKNSNFRHISSFFITFAKLRPLATNVPYGPKWNSLAIMYLRPPQKWYKFVFQATQICISNFRPPKCVFQIPGHQNM